MRLLIVLVMLFSSQLKANSIGVNPSNEKKEIKKEKEKDLSVKNFHSIKKWKITIEYTNGDCTSEVIIIPKNSKKSAMENAFSEAEKISKDLKNIKYYSVSPISKNSFVLLAEGK